MYNYQILVNNSKTEILEKLLKMSLDTHNWEEYEETAYHIEWLFEKTKPETNKFFEIKKEESKQDVQLPEN